MVIASTSSLGHFHGSNADPFGQSIRSTSNSAAHPLFGTSTPFGGGSAYNSERQSSPFGRTSGFPRTTKSGDIASTTGIGSQCQGSAVASYSATPEVDGNNSRYSARKIESISAMPVYKSKSHEELRIEDYELHNGITSSIQNQGNAFQQSSFGSLSWLASGIATAAVSNSSVNPPFCNTSTAFGVSPPFQFGGSIGDGNADRDPRNSAAGASSTKIFSAPNNSKVGFKSSPTNLHSNSAHGSTSSVFGVSNMPSFAPARASTGFKTSMFGLPSTSVFEGSSVSAFQVSTTPGFGVTSTPSSWSTSPSFAPTNASTGFKTSIFGVPITSTSTSSSWSTSASVGSTSNFPISTISGLCFNSSASSSSSIFAAQTSSGSQRTTTIESTSGKQRQGSRVASYSATKEVYRANNKFFADKIQSISAMPVYKSKSHEELRSEDYELCNKGGQTILGSQYLSSSCFKTSDTPPNIFRSTPSSNQSLVNSPFQPFKSNLSAPKTGNFLTPNITISTAPTPSPSVNPFSCTNLRLSQSQSFIPLPTAVSSVPTLTPCLNPSSLIPSSQSMLANTFQCQKESKTLTNPSVGTFSSSKPSVTLQSTLVTASDRWPSFLNASQPGHTAEKVDSLSANGLSQPSLSSNGLTTVKDLSSQNLKGQQYVPSSTSGVQSSLVVNPFATESPVDQPNAVTSIQYGISSLPVSENLSSNRRTSLWRIRHVSFRHPSLTAQRHSCGSSETKVPFFIDEADGVGPISPLLPRENPRDWVKNSMFLRSDSNCKGCRDKGNSTELTDDTSLQEEDLSTTLNRHQDYVSAVTEEHEGDVLATMPKFQDGEYYTEPSLKELAAKEMAEPGYRSRVKDFVVGRWGYGSIKFLGETDVRHLDIESIVQFSNREVIVYPDDRKKPAVGQGLNKSAEVTLLNVKCISKKTGKQSVEGIQVDRYREMLIRKTSEQGAEFVSYDPVQGEWKFRVQHF